MNKLLFFKTFDTVRFFWLNKGINLMNMEVRYEIYKKVGENLYINIEGYFSRIFDTLNRILLNRIIVDIIANYSIPSRKFDFFHFPTGILMLQLWEFKKSFTPKIFICLPQIPHSELLVIFFNSLKKHILGA